MLYTKYRPQKFAELVGLETVKDNLLNQVQSGKIAHAYLFSGPRGTGKTTTARILAKALNCEKLKDGEPCGKCTFCTQIQEGRLVDLIEIDAASNRGIDDIRSLREKVRLAPAHGKFKVYIIDEAHMLTSEAANALLKTLEEPPAHAVFILATTEPHKLPDTIRSRCQRFTFERAPVSKIAEKLNDIVKKENLKINPTQISQIAKAAGGGFRDAETLLEQVAAGAQDLEKLVGFARLGELGEFFSDVIAQDTKKALLFISSLSTAGVDMSIFNVAALEYLRDLLLIQAGVGSDLVDAGKEQFSLLKEQADKLTAQRLSEMITIFTQAYENLPQAAIPSLPLEVAVVEATRPSTASKKMEDKALVEEPKVTRNPSFSGGKLDDLIAAAEPLNHSVAGLLRSCRLGEIKGKVLTLEAFYPWHKEKLESISSQPILKQAVEQVFGSSFTVKVELAQK
ncbi:MAG: DNA polymerase III subunit gamma/tau [Patescibacteria group bacterium]